MNSRRSTSTSASSLPSPAATVPPIIDGAEARRRTLLLQARKQRLAWIHNEDLELQPPDQVDGTGQHHLLPSSSSSSSSSRQTSTKRTTLSTLFETVPGMDGVLPAAKEYVGFLNTLAGEDEREMIEYHPESLLCLPPDEELLKEQEAMPLPPPFDLSDHTSSSYQSFLQRLEHPASAEVVKMMQRFVTAFIHKQQHQQRLSSSSSISSSSLYSPPPPQPLTSLSISTASPESIHAFIDSLRPEFRKSDAWRLGGPSTNSSNSSSTTTPDSWWEALREHLEKFLLIKLHTYLFTEEELKDLAVQDAAWWARVQSLAFVGPEHLDVPSLLQGRVTNNNNKNGGGGGGGGSNGQHPIHPPSPHQILQPAIQEFQRLVTYKAPQDMMSCLLRCSHRLTQALMNSRAPGTGLPGADEFLPAMILVIKESNPPGLRRALETIQRYRHPRRLQVSEPAYVFTQTMSAVHFLEQADAGQLGMTPEAFARSLVACRPRPLSSSGSAAVVGGVVVPSEREMEKGKESGERDGMSMRRLSSSLASSCSVSSSAAFLSTSTLNNMALSTSNFVATKDGLTTHTLPPLWSIHDIRRERTAAAALAGGGVGGVGKGGGGGERGLIPQHQQQHMHPPSSFSPLRLQDLAERVHQSTPHPSLLRRTTSGLSSHSLRSACSFLTVASPEDLRVCDIALLLEEYRSLASLSADLLDALQQ